MKRFMAVIIAVVLLCCWLTLSAQEQKAPVPAKASAEEKIAPAKEKATGEELKTTQEKLGYSFGVEIGSSLKEIQAEIEIDAFLKGIKDSVEGKNLLLTAEQMEEVKKEFVTKMQAEREKKTKELGDKNKKDEETFFAENKKKEGVKTTESGLQYIVVKEGDGAKPKETDSVKVNYSGTLLDGTEFDSSYKRGEPAVFPVKGVIPGWTEALQLMKVGGKYKLFIPSKLAYGERGAGPTIGPNSTLTFEVELLSIEKQTEKPEVKAEKEEVKAKAEKQEVKPKAEKQEVKTKTEK
jgi:FKBP-type peptidyl-prolyl cis-trans isomerase